MKSFKYVKSEQLVFCFQFIIGNGENMCDVTYAENVAHANICAEQTLESDETSVAGQVSLNLLLSFCL